ncbi:Gfo/Idh/MocA family protein [Paenibacillus thalictri]|uniref:Gfo/Idh/MocA family oxidoreductase n=1 Tax=Paenibacillus thalictri TaxID=2527873 RepID=A0A4Q9DY91_9BACL|nr:Gfo/Idh/MocA family oxidoreductase [Paenibacillus thalictri]TBL81365.1 Gfo/Idh/MocA family oxidoreductase [Paenibacillus thalictri]
MLQAALLGAGRRGMFAYASYALKRPDEIQFVAVAEPDEERRQMFARQHGIPPERQFASWEELLAEPRLCEALLICTQDRMHFEPTMKALEMGYHILLEKPMSHDPLESILLAEEAERRQRILTICHVSRYDTYYSEVKALLDTGVIGRIMSIQWTENVGFWHHSHSFVRGNWRNSDETSAMILQKSCHDMDLLQWFVGEECTSVSSYGSLSYFRPENAPKGSTERCTSGCEVEHECSFSAIKHYYNEDDTGFPMAVCLTPTLEARLKAITEGPYGRCVFRCDNNVVDHQVVNLVFDNEATVSFTMSAFTTENTRTFKIMGTSGEIRGHHQNNEIEIRHFSGKTELIRPKRFEGGHGGADFLIMREFVRQVRRGDLNGKTPAAVSARSHIMAFAAEHSRLTGQTVNLNHYMAELKEGSSARG